MCGHVGLIRSGKSRFDYRETQIFKQMLFVDELRGQDATGICIVNTEQGASVFKEGSEAGNFLLDKEVIAGIAKSITSGVALLGHNRKATIGGHKDKNAHPFTYEDRYVFFHNGTLTNHKVFGDEEVDSESFGKHLVATEGDPVKVSEVINKAYGAWCCVWYDSVKHCIYFLRNKERPLYFLYTKEGNITYSSEAWIADGCSIRNGVVYEKTESCEEDTLYTLDLTQTKLEFKKEKLEKKVQAVMPPGSPVVIGGKKTKNHISKRLGLDYIKELNKTQWIKFKVTDITSLHPEHEPAHNQTGDWIVFGCIDDMPGVQFRGIIENIYPWEAEMLEGDYVQGYLTGAEYGSGVVEAWFKEVYKCNYNQKCH